MDRDRIPRGRAVFAVAIPLLGVLAFGCAYPAANLKPPGRLAAVVIPKRPFGHTGVQVPILGQGTWQLRDKSAAAEALRVGFELGMTHIDTAELYTGSEAVIREALLAGPQPGQDEPRPAGRGGVGDKRDEIFLVSKVLPRHASYQGTLDACAKSLQRLGTDHLDCYLLHWNTGDFPLSETMRAMGELVDSGKTRFVGVSNFDVDELEEAKSALGKHRLACNQVFYSLDARGVESHILPWCKRNGVALVGYSPFGSTNGFPSPKSRGGKVLADVAARLGKTAHQVTLSFLARDPSVFLIPKAEKAAHVRDNAGGAFELPKDALLEIEEAFPMKPGLSFL